MVSLPDISEEMQAAVQSDAAKEEKRRRENERKRLTRLDPVKGDAMRERERLQKAKKREDEEYRLADNQRRTRSDQAQRKETQQILARAAAGLSLDMTDNPAPEQIQGFDTDPTILPAKMAFWYNTGRGKFRDLDRLPALRDLLDKEETPKEVRAAAQARVDAFVNEIKGEAVTSEDAANIVHSFNEKIGQLKPLLGCASCGVRSVSMSFHRHDISSLGCLMLSPTQAAQHEALGEYKAAASVVEFEGSQYFLHPELAVPDPISRKPQIDLCADCHQAVKKKEVPKFSVANGFDFGDVRRLKDVLSEDKALPPLSLVEKHLISRVRLYASIVKLSHNERNRRILRGHVISFFQDGPEMAAKTLKTLPDLEAVNSIKVMFVGPTGQFEHSRKDSAIACHELRVRPQVVFSWLAFLKKVQSLL